MGYQRETSARQKALELNKKKEAMEAEMEAIHSSLTAEGAPGLTGNLIDAQGFPRADIDILQIRTQRNRLAVLKTDYKAISAEIEQQMYIALAPQKDQAAAFPTTGATSQTPASVPRTDASTSAPPHTPPQVPHVPFALVDIVTPSSPAETAGLLVGDRILSFGAVSLRAFATPNLAMGALPGLLRDHENRTVDVAVERSDGPALTAHTLNLTPRRWSGQGLLGCHVVPLTVNQVDSRYAPQVEVEAAVKSNADKV